MLGPAFYDKLNKISNELGMNPRDILLVMSSESGVDPKAHNPGGATGLIQFMPSSLKNMGLSNEEVKTFGEKSAEDQLDYVKEFILRSQRSFNNGQPYGSATKYYHANFFPATLNRWHGNDPASNRNVIVVNRDSKNPAERAAYKENQILDPNHDGLITVADLATVLARQSRTSKFNNMMASLNEIAGEGNVSEKSHIRHNTMMDKPENKISKNDEGITGKVVDYFISKLEEILDKIASKDYNISKYGTKYPKNNLLITIVSNSDFTTQLEYAKVLKYALKEELITDSKIMTDNSNVELECTIFASKIDTLETVKEICNAVSDVFQTATKKIGNNKIDTILAINSLSNYRELDKKISEEQYNKFKLKFSGPTK